MDLRPYKLDNKHVEDAIGFMRQHFLCYQPYVITDVLEVGEGQNFHDGYVREKNIYGYSVFSDRDLQLGKPQASDVMHFRKCNAEYRMLYDAFADQIVEYFKHDLATLTVAEMGCNSGLHLFNLAKRGVKKCVGYDWNNMTELFGWLNNILGTQVEFHTAIWDRLYHRLEGAVFEKSDLVISAVVLNHQIDFLQHLAFLCDHAKSAVFLWVLTDKNDASDGYEAAWNYAPSRQYGISYAEPNSLTPVVAGGEWNGHPFPLCFDHGICISDPLLKRSLNYLGFDEIIELNQPVLSPKWQPFCKGFKPYLAIRTRDVKSAYTW